jgi:cysteine synthase
VTAAFDVAKRLEQGVVTTLIPDDGSKYVSLGIFDVEE